MNTEKLIQYVDAAIFGFESVIKHHANSIHSIIKDNNETKKIVDKFDASVRADIAMLKHLKEDLEKEMKTSK